MPEHQPRLALRRDTEQPVGDLAVCTAHADLEHAQPHLAGARLDLRDVLDARRARDARLDDERLHQAAVRPPSITSTLPVTNAARSEAR